MNDLQTIHSIFNGSPINNMIVSSVLFILYLFINRLFDYLKKKDSNKIYNELAVQSKTINKLHLNLNKLNDNFNIFASNDRNIEIYKTFIDLSFVNFEKNLFDFVRTIVINNNIVQNKCLIESNIKQKVSSEYYMLLKHLAMLDEKPNSYLKENWITELNDNIIIIIFLDDDKTNRINMIKNKLSIIISGYSTYIYNKTY